MMTDVMIQKKGIEALVKELGNVDAERFINIATKNPFDYTEWRKTNVHENISVRDLSKKAMAVEMREHDRLKLKLNNSSNYKPQKKICNKKVIYQLKTNVVSGSSALIKQIKSLLKKDVAEKIIAGGLYKNNDAANIINNLIVCGCRYKIFSDEIDKKDNTYKDYLYVNKLWIIEAVSNKIVFDKLVLTNLSNQAFFEKIKKADGARVDGTFNASSGNTYKLLKNYDYKVVDKQVVNDFILKNSDPKVAEKIRKK